MPPSNPAHVASVNDLAKKSVKTALCQPQVPCGVAAAEVFKNAGITVTPVTLEPDVKSVLAQVELGAVDAGMVDVTDVQAAGRKVTGVTITPRQRLDALPDRDASARHPPERRAGVRRLRAVFGGPAGAPVVGFEPDPGRGYPR